MESVVGIVQQVSVLVMSVVLIKDVLQVITIVVQRIGVVAVQLIIHHHPVPQDVLLIVSLVQLLLIMD
jgi:hypothetical protein